MARWSIAARTRAINKARARRGLHPVTEEQVSQWYFKKVEKAPKPEPKKSPKTKKPKKPHKPHKKPIEKRISLDDLLAIGQPRKGRRAKERSLDDMLADLFPMLVPKKKRGRPALPAKEKRRRQAKKKHKKEWEKLNGAKKEPEPKRNEKPAIDKDKQRLAREHLKKKRKRAGG